MKAVPVGLEQGRVLLYFDGACQPEQPVWPGGLRFLRND